MNFLAKYDPSQKLSFAEVFKIHKVVHVHNIPVDESVSSYYKQLATSVGYPMIYEEDPQTGKIEANKWTEIKNNQEADQTSYKRSNTYQPLHTDYGYFAIEVFASFFYCEKQASFGGATTFIDAAKVADLLRKIDLQLFESINQTEIRFGRGDHPIANATSPILSQDEQGWKINWNYYRAKGDLKNSAVIEDFRSFLETYIEKSGELTEIKLQANEAVYFHDRRVLHGRNSFWGDRHLNKGGITQEKIEIKL
jgi:alpha-ketoglutarate-dependent taurine dioxygenase